MANLAGLVCGEGRRVFILPGFSVPNALLQCFSFAIYTHTKFKLLQEISFYQNYKFWNLEKGVLGSQKINHGKGVVNCKKRSFV